MLEAYLCNAIETGPAKGLMDEQVNASLANSYKRILSSSLSSGGLQTIAHRIKRRVKSQFLIRLGEEVYLHIKNRRRFYRRCSEIRCDL